MLKVMYRQNNNNNNSTSTRSLGEILIDNSKMKTSSSSCRNGGGCDNNNDNEKDSADEKGIMEQVKSKINNIKKNKMMKAATKKSKSLNNVYDADRSNFSHEKKSSSRTTKSDGSSANNKKKSNNNNTMSATTIAKALLQQQQKQQQQQQKYIEEEETEAYQQHEEQEYEHEQEEHEYECDEHNDYKYDQQQQNLLLLYRDASNYVSDVVNDVTSYSKILNNSQDNAVSLLPTFDRSEIHLGDLLGSGGFNDVYEIDNIQMKQQRTYERRSSMSDIPGTYCSKNSDDTVDEMSRIRRRFFRNYLKKTTSTKTTSCSDLYAIKFIQSKDSIETYEDKTKFCDSMADLVMETKYLTALSTNKEYAHPNIIKVHGVSSSTPLNNGDTNSFLNDGQYFIILDRLTDTLYDRIPVWKEFRRRQISIGDNSSSSSSNSTRRKDLLIKNATVDTLLLIKQLRVALDISSAVQHLHKLNIVYRDLKLDNIGFDRYGTVKIFDFGLAREIDPNEAIQKEEEKNEVDQEDEDEDYHHDDHNNDDHNKDDDVSTIGGDSCSPFNKNNENDEFFNKANNANDDDNDDDENDTTDDLLYDMTERCGNVRYMAPEMYSNVGKYNAKIDTYSFGIVLWCICNLETKPYPAIKRNDDIPYMVFDNDVRPNISNLYNKSNQFIFGTTSTSSSNSSNSSTQQLKSVGTSIKVICDLMEQCWSKESSNRPTMTNINSTIKKEIQYLHKVTGLISSTKGGDSSRGGSATEDSSTSKEEPKVQAKQQRRRHSMVSTTTTTTRTSGGHNDNTYHYDKVSSSPSPPMTTSSSSHRNHHHHHHCDIPKSIITMTEKKHQKASRRLSY